ncbi:hypothetical protein CIB43_00484 [Mesomycoplasma hyopneumoniae]|uniref:Uncharacterized protein n=1 Tax=Mesomycoplasma hyopneumoniae TaxID=2099 RepID=A0A223M9Z2_MESHO|nr:hypothetical protein CIB43_00484 [Mesomycoplasma hyopneumoniae]
MKNLELNNLLSLGNIVVVQPYEENLKNELKNLFARIEDNFWAKSKIKKQKSRKKEVYLLNINVSLSRIE